MILASKFLFVYHPIAPSSFMFIMSVRALLCRVIEPVVSGSPESWLNTISVNPAFVIAGFEVIGSLSGFALAYAVP